MRDEIVVGSRGSKLALVQAQLVIDCLKRNNPSLSARVEIIKTTGDRIVDRALAEVPSRGVFVREIEQALLDAQIDLAVHSMKDLPTEETSGLVIAAIPERDDPADALVSRLGDIASLPRGAVLGSSSQRRRAQILHFRPDLGVKDLRGNLDTRIRRLESEECDGIVVAAAGLNRLGWVGERHRIPFEICLPAVGQGALAVQCRADDRHILDLLRPLDDPATRAAVLAERSLMRTLQGGCQTPVGAMARVERQALKLEAVVADVAGERLIRRSGYGNIGEADVLGQSVAEEMLDAGARGLLEQIHVTGQRYRAGRPQ